MQANRSYIDLFLIGSMSGISIAAFTIKNQPDVGKYTIHGYKTRIEINQMDPICLALPRTASVVLIPAFPLLTVNGTANARYNFACSSVNSGSLEKHLVGAREASVICGICGENLFLSLRLFQHTFGTHP